MENANPKRPIKSWHEDDRPREKFLLKGRDALSDAELLAILLASGSANESALDLARRILNDVSNNLLELSKLDISALKKYKGVGTVKAITLAAALELGRRRRQAEALQKKNIACSKDIYEYMQAEMSDKAYEEFWVINLNTAHKIINKTFIGEGGLSQATVDIRRIFKSSLECNASAIVLCHNHPSGNINPSNNDIELTQKIKKAGDILSIKVLDHIVSGEESYYSFADNGLM
ncbi:MAG: hypothetical protein BWY70_01240 [Bacteroidetes bacterium ADurb.Bin408]|nr:MAG: hypothetical protein BWY70_01240 [Bacteroidetes bacterium ADurb.Bin408]